MYPLKIPKIKPKILSIEPTPVQVTALAKIFPITIVKNKVKIKINGRKRSINSKISLKSLLSTNKISLKKVAVEVNEKIINKKMINKIKIKNGDEIEIVHFIGGG